MNKAILSMGGNVGNSLEILSKAIDDISSLATVSGVKTSRFYQTKPVGDANQSDFINLALELTTDQSSEELHKNLQEIENANGKVFVRENGPRTLDIDILFFNNEVQETSTLSIPHPRWKERLFVLIPLLDLKSEVRIGEQTNSIQSLIDGFSEKEIQSVKCVDRSRRKSPYV